MDNGSHAGGDNCSVGNLSASSRWPREFYHETIRGIVPEVYKNLKRMQHYQIFAVQHAKPGEVAYQVGPTDEAVVQDLRRTVDGIHTDETKLRGLFNTHLDPLEPLLPNFEKKQLMYNKVRAYVPRDFAADPIYNAPNDEEERLANEAKRARQMKRKEAAAKKQHRSDVTAGTDARGDDTIENIDNANAPKSAAAQPKTTQPRKKRAKKYPES